MKEYPFLYWFLGAERFKALFRELQKNWSESAAPVVPWTAAVSAILIGSLPLLVSFLPYTFSFDLKSLTVGAATLAAICLRVRYGIRYVLTDKLQVSLSLTHTAFALGCVPFVIIILLFPGETFFLLETGSSDSTTAQPSLLEISGFIFLVSSWAALTEEWIYRGLIIGVLRRVSFARNQRTRDLIAIFFSAALFSCAHFGTWGLALSIGLFGVGVGFGVAYIATGERLVPLMIYHFLFDILSLSVALLRAPS